MPSTHFATRKPCAFFAQGRCNRGASCSFDHASNLTPTKISIEIPICKFFARGSCTNVACTFRHERASYKPSGTVSFGVPQALHTSSRTVVCRFYAAGDCHKGDACPFPHAPPATSSNISTSALPVPSSPTTLPPRRNHSVAIKPREAVSTLNFKHVSPVSAMETPTNTPAKTLSKTVYACKASFGPGLGVIAVETDLESSRLLVNNLPEDVVLAEVEEMLAIFGDVEVQLLASSIRPMALADFVETSAAASAARSLNGSTYRRRTLAVRLEPRPPKGGELGQVRDTVVKATWFAPSAIAYCHYDTMSEAKRAATRTDTRTFDGRKISTTVQPPTFRQAESFTVIVSGLSGSPNRQGLQRFMRCGSMSVKQPRHDIEAAIRGLKSSLDTNDEGQLESFEVINSSLTESKIKAIARYSSVASAGHAVDFLDKRKMTYLNNSPLWLVHLLSVKFTLPPNQYKALAPRIEGLRRDFSRSSGITSGEELRWSIFEPPPGVTDGVVVTVRISGEQVVALGRAKIKMERLLVGTPLHDVDGSTAWDDHLLTKEGRVIVSASVQAINVHMRYDSDRHQVTIYGPDDTMVKGARVLVLAALAQIRNLRHALELSPTRFSRLLRTGLRHLRDTYGSDRISLDLTQRILLFRVDSPADSAAIRSYVDQLDSSEAPPPPTSGTDCPVCMCEVTDVATLACSHQYCGQCLDLMLESASSFPVACMVDTCHTPIALRTISTRIALPTLEALLQKAGKAYINEHPDEFKFCPTPDCSHIYRPGPEGSVLQCKGCLSYTCASCHVAAHEGFSCAEQREISDPAERHFRRWKTENDVKPCPNCKADIQKSAGCNHMTCTQCRTHLCWVCMKTFPGGDGIYEHMRRAHGSIGV